MPTLPRSQRIMALDKDDNVIFKSRRLKVEYGHIAVHHDVEVSYNPHPTDTTKAIKTVSGSFVIFTPDEFCEFCANPPEWFRGEFEVSALAEEAASKVRERMNIELSDAEAKKVSMPGKILPAGVYENGPTLEDLVDPPKVNKNAC